jgi:hypothetical protein
MYILYLDNFSKIKTVYSDKTQIILLNALRFYLYNAYYIRK